MAQKAGLRNPRGREILTDAELRATLDSNQLNTVQVLARKYTAASVRALARILKDKDSPKPSVIAAAKAMLEFGWGKAAPQFAEQGPGGVDIQVNILHLSTGEKVSIGVPSEGVSIEVPFEPVPVDAEEVLGITEKAAP